MNSSSGNEPKVSIKLSPEERRAQYNRVVREANLVTIDLKDVVFSVDPLAQTGAEDGRKRVFSSEVRDFSFDLEHKFAFACLRWSLDIKFNNKKVVKCRVDYNVLYDGFTCENEEIVKLFIENVAAPATYAYFRALYAQLDWSAGLNSPPLPVVKFMAKV